MNKVITVYWNCVLCKEEYYSHAKENASYIQLGAMADSYRLDENVIVEPVTCDHCKSNTRKLIH